MIPTLKLLCKSLFQLVGLILKRCFSKFLPTCIVYEAHSVQLPIYDGGAPDNLTGHQQRTRSRSFRRSDQLSETRKSTDEPSFYNRQVVETPFQVGYADSLRRRDEVIRWLLRTDHICNGFMAFGSTVPIGSCSSEFEDAEGSLTHTESYHAEETTDSSLNDDILSCGISKFLQSVIKTLENMQKASESFELAAEPSVMPADSKREPTSDWVVESFPNISESVEQTLTRTTESLAIAAVSTRENSIRSLSATTGVRRKQSLDSSEVSFPEVIESKELSLQNVAESPTSAESIESTVQNTSESSNSDITEISELENDSEPISTENIEAILQNITNSILMTTESNETTLQSQTESSKEVIENSEASLDNATGLLRRTESRESTCEQLISDQLVSVEASPERDTLIPQSSSFITFKGINKKCPYMPQLVAADLGMKESAHDWDVNWTHDFVSFRTCRKLKRHQRINHFPGSICLSNKDLLGRNLNAMYECFPNDYDIFPKTWFIPGDMQKIERYARKNRGASFIVKPHDGGAGSGIKITSSLREVNSRGKIVCQLYIQRPFLIDGYKFDFRVYVLMTSIEPLRVFVHKEGLARFATVKYEQPSASNSSTKWMHLTNTCVNKNSPSYIRDESKGSTRRITDVFQWFIDHSIDVSKVQDSMDDTIIKTIIVCLPTLQHYYHMSFPYHTTSISCFELMGFDIMLDHKLKVYLLEVNVAPSFANETGTSHVACIKREVVSDAFKILNLMETEKDQVIEGKKVFSEGRAKGLQKDEKRVRRMNSNKVKDKLITNRRIQWETSHMGSFRKIYPPGATRGRYYQKFIDKAISILRPNYLLNSRDHELTGEQRKWLT